MKKVTADAFKVYRAVYEAKAMGHSTPSVNDIATKMEMPFQTVSGVCKRHKIKLNYASETRRNGRNGLEKELVF